MDDDNRATWNTTTIRGTDPPPLRWVERGPLAGAVPALTEEQREALRRALKGMQPQPVISVPQAPASDVFRLGVLLESLMKVLKLSDAERGFVQHLAENPSDDSAVLIFADWLEERRRDAEAARLRQVARGGG